MDKVKLKGALEALIFMSSEPISISELIDILQSKESSEEPKTEEEGQLNPLAKEEAGEGDESVEKDGEVSDPLSQLRAMQTKYEEEISKSDVKGLLDEIESEHRDNLAKGFELVRVAKGYQFRTKECMAPLVRKLYKLPKPRLSTPGMETLAIVAYQQPINRAKIEQIRGVDSGGVLKTLLERELVRIVGRSEEPGRPILYGTTGKFLETFNLSSLSDLPTLKDLESLESASVAVNQDQSEKGDLEEPFSTEEELELDPNIIDEESSELLEDLENSLKSLKGIEKDIFPKEENKEDQEQEEVIENPTV